MSEHNTTVEDFARNAEDHAHACIYADSMPGHRPSRVCLCGCGERFDATSRPCPICDGRGVWMDEPCECAIPPGSGPS